MGSTGEAALSEGAGGKASLPACHYIALLGSLHSDWVFASPIAWALLAIGVQQQSPTYPGGATASMAGFVLGGLLIPAILAVAVWRLWLWWRGKSAAFVKVENPIAAVGDSYAAVDNQGLIKEGV